MHRKKGFLIRNCWTCCPSAPTRCCGISAQCQAMGISGHPETLAFILEEPVKIEDSSGTYLICDPVLLNDRMYVLLDCQLPNFDSAEKAAWDESIFLPVLY